MVQKKVITYALPYANGMLHLGHIMGMVQADCYVRAQRLMNVPVTFVCGDDAHGTPIMLNAEKQGVTPDVLVEKIYQAHVRDYKAFHISFDGYHTTHCALNTEIVHSVYQRLQDADVIVQKEIEQAYDDSKAMFLPDRYIKGSCPKCHAEDQYGDHCEACGKTYAIRELQNPRSIMSDTPPIWKTSAHDFFQLSTQQVIVSNWLSNVDMQESVKNKLSEWFNEGLQDWDITRDEPYFGIGIPGQPGKYFYVWLDAPFGYMSSLGLTKGLTAPQAVFEDWQDSTIEHFIGKDIVSFHGVFWPAVLEKAGLKTPDKVHVHGFLTLSGDKMSKSRGTFVETQDYLEKLPADLLRYYFASRLSPSVIDVDLDWNDFMQKINADLVGKLANIGSRSQGFIHKLYNGQLGDTLDQDFWDKITAKHEDVLQAYQAVNLAQVCRLVMELCDETNQYVDHHKPWVLAKADDQENLYEVLTTTMNAFRYLAYLLSPIIPEISQKVADAFGDEAPTIVVEQYLNHSIQKFPHLLSRVTEDQIEF